MSNMGVIGFGISLKEQQMEVKSVHGGRFHLQTHTDLTSSFFDNVPTICYAITVLSLQMAQSLVVKVCL